MLYKGRHNYELILAEKVIQIAVKSIIKLLRQNVNNWGKKLLIGLRPVNRPSTTYWGEAQIPF
jgi:hypothetical protein